MSAAVWSFFVAACGFGVRGLGFRVWGLGFEDWGQGFEDWGVRCGMWGVGCRVQGFMDMRGAPGDFPEGLDCELFKSFYGTMRGGSTVLVQDLFQSTLVLGFLPDTCSSTVGFSRCGQARVQKISGTLFQRPGSVLSQSERAVIRDEQVGVGNSV